MAEVISRSVSCVESYNWQVKLGSLWRSVDVSMLVLLRHSTHFFFFFIKVVQTHSTPAKKKNQVRINILQETPRLVSHCQNKLNRFNKAIKKKLLPPCLERLFFFFINTGKYWLCSVCRNIFQEMESMQWACECFSSHTFSISFFCFVFKVSGFFLSQYIHRLKSHSRLKKKKTLLQTTNSERVRKETLVGSCVSSPVSTLKLVREKKTSSVCIFSVPVPERWADLQRSALDLCSRYTHTSNVWKLGLQKKKKKKKKWKTTQKTFLKSLF